MIDDNTASDIREERVLVTPRIAAEWLLLNDQNRSVRRTLVNQYATDMINGDWMYTGDAIRFAKRPDGTEILIDGQHRLLAVLKSKTAIQFKVERGYSPKVQRVVDIGARRFLADQLRIEDYADAKYLPQIARRVYGWQTNHNPIVRGGLSPQQLRKVIFEDGPNGEPRVKPLMASAADYASKHQRGIMPVASLGFLYWLLVPIESDQAVEFLNRADDGAGLPLPTEEGLKDPVMLLRDRIHGERNSSVKPNERNIIAYSIMAWNLKREGRRGKILKLPNGGLTSETFPDPK